jgi:hypothetical protein
MALLANITAADLKKGDIIMFAMGSSSPGRVAPPADQYLGGQFACAPMSYSMFSAIADVTYAVGIPNGSDFVVKAMQLSLEKFIGLRRT